MSQQSPPPPPPPPSPGRSPRGTGSGRESLPRWSIWVLAGVILAVLVLPSFMNRTDRREIDYSDLLTRVEQGQIEELDWNNNDGSITGQLDDGTEFESNGPLEHSEDDRALFREHDVTVQFSSPGSSWLTALLPLLIPVALFIGIFWLMQRRAQSQMGGIMSIGRSRAKTYSTERPGTTFADVAGYEGVKQEVTEVVDFLRHPERFAEIGARVPKGVLLVGPPGTGKTLIARAVAGEAGVPFLSVTGSDFMEMFVGVGASRVRDLFQNARKLGRAIIFVDEIDSIGRKRGAGLGGGHDEREQTLNQMLSEMGGADLANLVNEAALFAVRDGSDEIRNTDFEQARDRVLMGQRRDSMALSDREKEVIAYHEAGHAVCAAVLPNADPVHKVTILPIGMALGVTQQLPVDEKHIYRQDYIEESPVVRMGGRVAEELVFGVISTGANNDLVGSTELARKMVSEWGMSTRVGPMAWGSAGQVFLGEDRKGLDLVARALLEHETIDGAEVTRLIRLAANGDGAEPGPNGGEVPEPARAPGREGGIEIGPDRGPDAPAPSRAPGEAMAGSRPPYPPPPAPPT